MSVKIRRKRSDDRAEQILRDPKSYFEKARRAARAQVRAEMAAKLTPGHGRVHRPA